VKSSLGRLAGSRERAVSIGVIYAVVQETVNLMAEFGFRLNSRLSFGLIQMPAAKIRRPPSINRLKPLPGSEFTWFLPAKSRVCRLFADDELEAGSQPSGRAFDLL
jgi:hypothetical protein